MSDDRNGVVLKKFHHGCELVVAEGPAAKGMMRMNRYRNRRRDGNNSYVLTMLLLVGTRIRSRGGQRDGEKQEAPVPASPSPGPGLCGGPAKVIRRSSEGDGGASKSRRRALGAKEDVRVEERGRRGRLQ